ncbi:hypothetical protein L917_21741, partial [Phytophthora nicotianae]
MLTPGDQIGKRTGTGSEASVDISRRSLVGPAVEIPEGDETECPVKTKPIESDPELPAASQPLEDDQVCISEGGESFAEDVDNQMAVLPELTTTTEDVKLEDIRIENDGKSKMEEVDRLRKIIWSRQYLLLGKGTALDVVCDIDTGDAEPVAQRVRRVAPQFRGK